MISVCVNLFAQNVRKRNSLFARILGCVLLSLLSCWNLYGTESASKTDTNNTGAEKQEKDNTEKTEEELAAGHSYHGEAFNEGPRQAAYLMKGTGKVHFPVKTNNELVQKYINQGVGQLHGFWYFEAERTFRQAASIDPDCAAAYWGMAMANSKNKDRAKKFCEEAVQRKDKASPRVQRYIDALKNLLDNYGKNKKSASEKYIKALDKIFYEFPEDIEAKAFIALHMWEGRSSGIKIYSHLAVDALIGEVLRHEPMHPIHHYRIHLWDYEKPERALVSAALCGQSAPSIAHMWHMPGHIFSRLKRYDDAVWQQEASARTDHAHMMRDRVLPDQIHNFAHNNEWLIRNLIFIGRIRDAMDLAKNMTEMPRHPKYNSVSKSNSSSGYGRRRLFQVLSEAELWDELIALGDTPYLEPTDVFNEQIKRLRYLSRAYFRSGRFAEGKKIIEQLDEQIAKLNKEEESAVQEAKQKAESEKKKKPEIEKATKKVRDNFNRKKKRIEKVKQESDAYLALLYGKVNEALELFKKSGETDKAYLARIQFQLGNPEEAFQQIKSHADRSKNQTLPLAHLVDIAWQAGKKEESKAAFKKLRDISGHLDIEAPAFARLAPIAEQLSLPTDWRVTKPLSKDIGERPALDSLGPFRWQPSPASKWQLANAYGENFTLDKYHGRPIILIFYLGFGCLHCAEQLQAFGPQVEEFRQAGIEIVGISTEDQDELKGALVDFNGSFAFPLLTNKSLDVFKDYRVYDDFEKQPLHGTFIIDENGMVRWHDISYEPFMDHEFVLTEAKRLLAQERKSQPNMATAAR